MSLQLRKQERTDQAKAAKRVALLIESSRGYGRGLLYGIIPYQREHAPWEVVFQPQGKPSAHFVFNTPRRLPWTNMRDS